MNNKCALALIAFLLCLAGGLCRADGTNVLAVTDTNAPAATNGYRPETERVATIGDNAFPLYVMEWIKGRPVKIQPGTNVYVLVFCDLTRANEFALTNLNALQAKYQDKGLITVAVSSGGPQELKQFVLMKGADIHFIVAADDLPSRTASTYQHAFRQVQMPRAYIVGTNATVLWQGHPLKDGMGAVVDDVVNGRYSLESMRKQLARRDQLEQYLMLARMKDGRSQLAGRQLFGFWAEDAGALLELASKIATDADIDNDQRDVRLANAALDQAFRLSNTNDTDIAVTRAILLFQTGRQKAGLKAAQAALAQAQTPDAREEVQNTIHAMEVRLELERTNVISTNGVAGGSATNQAKTSPASPK